MSGERKVAVARRLLAEGGRITLLTAHEDVPGFVAELAESRSANHLTQTIREKLDEVARGMDDVSTVVVTGKAGVKVAQFARRNGVDLIIPGSHQPRASG